MHYWFTRSSSTALALAVLLLTGCGLPGAASDAPGPASEGGTRINVVTSTDVYGDIVKTLGGNRVDVVPLISGLNQDPHSYESTVRDKLAISEADLVIRNGGGYDPFMHQIITGLNLREDRVITAVEVAGLDTDKSHAADKHHHGQFNEHVWYDISSVIRIADRIAARLAAIDPAGAQEYTARADEFTAGVARISTQLADIETRHGGEQVVLTEPLPVYLLEDAGLEDQTPEDFLEAAEHGHDAPMRSFKDTMDLVSSTSLGFLGYNQQRPGTQTQAIREAAATAKVPVVKFTETLPEGKTFTQWMSENAENIDQALQH